MGTSWVDYFVPVSDQRCVCVGLCVRKEVVLGPVFGSSLALSEETR